MNLSEPYRARTSAFVALAAAGWEGYALRVALLALGLSIYILLFKKRNSPGARSSSRGSRDVPDDGDGDGDGDDDASDHLNGEVCPICLGVPKIGVKAPCGHLLCADCLASYCDVRITPAPPPCPLCRAPLNSVALACDFVSNVARTVACRARRLARCPPLGGGEGCPCF
ncbi:peroxisome biogenesis factor 10-like [Harpegnathos saltator]|uniref:peroxisome biogenesis factor 10-like n=1 Tax=Harpegnathos saltator TaxID=610380 RepID=UPI000DBEDE0D|nr:peroxisome biogenesis factor 10-like [Harpegnathos saltator]